MADRRLYLEIVDRIMALVRDGDFPPGSRLPGERELAERFGVSRVTVREAAIALQSMGKVRIRTGSGIYVADDALCDGDALPNVSAFELTEARSLFEGEAAALAAPTISEDLLDRLDELLQAMDGADEEASNAADREFHMTIASASGNQAITHVIKELWRLRTELPEVRATHAAVCHHDGKTRHDEHSEIVAALRRRDAAGARLAMRRHFNRLLEAMLDAHEEREMNALRQKSAQSRARFLMTARLG
jgi:GntR family transcriptional regulator, hexuronate regulon transcriptional repressor